MNHARIAAEALRFRLGTFASDTADQGNGATAQELGDYVLSTVADSSLDRRWQEYVRAR